LSNFSNQALDAVFDFIPHVTHVFLGSAIRVGQIPIFGFCTGDFGTIITASHGNYLARPYLFFLPSAAAAALVAIRFFHQRRLYFRAWFASAATIVFATFFCLAGLFPNLFPSSMGDQYSLTAFNASSSQLTLTIMLVVVLAVIPIVIGYQIWAYRLFSGKLSQEDLAYEDVY
jgi:cytochrome d ubiquinol oxidase subunit II